jgi:16S rRNA (cytosine967-C5)-methyltransferase
MQRAYLRGAPVRWLPQADRRLLAVNAPVPPTSLALAKLLTHTADAVQAVRAGQSLNAALAKCPAAARPGTQALSFHALRWLGSAQVLRAQLAPKTPPPAVDALLLTALALLWPAAQAPYAEHVLVDQAVDAARQRAKQSAGFINAVLRRFLRERDALVAVALRDPLARFNHPGWWIDRLKADWPDRWPAILDADNERPPMTLRVNARRGDAAGYVSRLAERGLAGYAVGAQAVMLDQPCPVTQLPGFAEGDVSVQDAAAQRAAPLLVGDPSQPGLRAGARVLDACAAPGGKTAHLLEFAGRGSPIDVTALDIDAARCERIHENLNRLGLQARVLVADAQEPASWWPQHGNRQPYDAILLDAPCTASGIVRRHPDVRWLRRESDIGQLAIIQAGMLTTLWPLLKPGGRLLYCTCSVFREEGEHQIEAFLAHNTDALLRPSPGHLLPRTGPESGGVRDNLPGDHDGFFYALLQKRAP